MNKNMKIAKILDEYTVVINSGSSNGVSIGDEFQILDKKGSPVTDPDTGEEIGFLDLIKATVKVTEVQENMCICASPEYHVFQRNFFDLNPNDYGFKSKRRDKLNVDNLQITGGLSKSDAPIKVGDSVKFLKVKGS